MTELGAQTVPDRAAPHLCLWNTRRYYELNPDAADRYDRYDHHDADGRLVASWVGGVDGDGLVCGYGAPFAGPDFTRSYETLANVVEVVHAAIGRAAGRGLTHMQLRLKPPHHGEIEAHLLFTLLTAGFTVAEPNLNFYVDLRPYAGADEHEASLKPQVRRVITRGRALGLRTELVDPSDEDRWAEGHAVLEANRVSKGRPMRLSLQYVRNIRDAFPGLVRMIVTHTPDGGVCAAALLYRIAPGHDVVQYWGDAHHDLAVSPMGVLVHAVIDHALLTGAGFLDIGISTDHGRPNHGLIQFKRNYGAIAEPRLELSGSIADLMDSPLWDMGG